MSNEMNDDKLNRLAKARVPAPDAAARERALSAGRAAFEAAKEKSMAAPQGSGWRRRLSSIITSLKGNSIMDMRIPIGTAAIALLLVPLGYQLYSTTALTPPERKDVGQEAAIPAAPAEAKSERDEAIAPTPVAQMEATDAMADTSVSAPTMEAAKALGGAATATTNGIVAQDRAAPSPMSVPMTSLSMAPQQTEPSGDVFTSFDESPLKVARAEPVSTFSIDVDTASYSYVRRMLDDGYVPEPDAVRIEELVNYFPYDYAGPDSAETPFKASMAVFPTPWNPKTELLHIGIKGYVPPAGTDTASNLVFLIDTSGSMDEPDQLPLLKRAFGLLVDQLSVNDTVSIVVYAGSAGVVLEPTVATDKAKILAALDHLEAGGGTAGAEGIELAYRLAEQAKIANGTNRVILATDGDFNIGIDDPDALKTFIRAKRAAGISLSVLGVGRGNLDDATMQALAQNGDGNASYISNFKEAQKVLVTEGGSTLQTIAQDVKIQVEFNPAVVSEYRLIGYETRALNREDFNNDAVDAGDIGAGHTVTAIYEITPVGSGGELVDPLRYGTAVAPSGQSDEIAFLKMRYKLPGQSVSQLIEQKVTPDLVYGDIGQASDDMRFAAAVAAFGQKLKGSNYGAMEWAAIKALAQSGRGKDENGYRAEFVGLIGTAALLRPDSAPAR